MGKNLEKYLTIFKKYSISLENQIKFAVLRRNVKNARIKISNDLSVTAIVPLNYSVHKLDNLMREKMRWIARTINRLKQNSKSIVLSENQILLFGEVYEFIRDSSLKDRVLTFNASKMIKSDHNLSENKELLNVWYKNFAAKYIKQRVSEIADKYGFEFNRLFVRSQRTKWGTCSSDRNLSFNWRLILCPLFVMDYLIIHELSHLNEMNHSARFWQTVAGLYPDYEKAKKWLKEYEAFLFKF